MANMLIAIGGTGQHTALAVSRLAFLGALPQMILAVIDSEDSNELSSNLTTFGKTFTGDNKVHGYAEHPLIDGDRIYPPFEKALLKDPKFKDLFLSQNPQPVETEIFELAFDEQSADIPVKEGMYGRPSVGSTIFAQNKSRSLEKVFEKAKSTDAEKIFVTGSMVGGTGAGIMHQLVRALPEDKRIYGLVFLRWFDTAAGGAKQTISRATMERNMFYGLDYFFKDTRARLNAAMLLGIPEKAPADLSPLNVRSGELGEKPHFLHLIAAYGILELPRKAVTEKEVKGEGSVYAAAYEKREQMYDEKWESEKKLDWYVNRGLFVKEILDYVSSEHYIKQLDAMFGMVSGLLNKPKNVGTGLYETILRYKKAERKTKIQEMAQTWRALSQQYEFSIGWLDKVLGQMDEKKYSPTYSSVKGNNEQKADKVQKIWVDALPEGQANPPAPDVAREFYMKLVRSFVE